MHVVILSARTGWHTDELLRALADRGHVGVVLPYEALVARLGGRPPNASPADGATADRLTSHQVSVLDADAVLARIIPGGSLEQIIFRVDALHWIEDGGVPVVNSPRAIERTVDKFYTSALLRQAGLPTPDTVVCERASDAVLAVGEFGDAVLKPIFGSMGHGLVRVSDVEIARRVTRSLEQTRAVYYVQRWVEHGGRDVRVLVADGRVVGAIERLAPPGEWRTNVSLGGTAVSLYVPDAWADLAIRAAAAVGADYAGVDLVPGLDGSVWVLEVNGIPGWRGLQRATGVDVARAIVACVERRVARGARATRDAATEAAPR
jgi:RimK family alpha-L-glutamate ligase